MESQESSSSPDQEMAVSNPNAAVQGESGRQPKSGVGGSSSPDSQYESNIDLDEQQ